MSRYIKEQQIGFYFAINETPISALENDDEGVLIKQLDKIQEDAWQNLHETLPTLPEWMIRDETDGIEFCPYELCRNDAVTEDIDGMAAFSVFIARDSEIDDAQVIKAFKQAAVDAYLKAAETHGGTTRYLSAQSYTVCQVTEWARIEV